MSQGRALHQVQEIELAIIKHTREIKVINARLADDEEIRRFQAQFEAAQSALADAAKRIRGMESQIETVVTKRQAAETRLYSGKVKNPKELQDMQREVEALTRRRAELDDELLLLMMEREEADQAFQQSEAELKDMRGKREAEEQGQHKKKADLTKKAEGLMAERKRALKGIQAAALKTYSSLRTAKANRPVAVLKAKACGACGIEQNGAVIAAIHRDEHLVKCRHCGRILIGL